MKYNNDLTAEYVRSILNYDPETGLFRWKPRADKGSMQSQRNDLIGRIAGTVTHQDYVQIIINGKAYRANRLAWLYVIGEWPPRLIDHEDTIKTNNRFSNLRLASQTQNQANRGHNKNNKLGVKGVHQATDTGKFIAWITEGGRRRYLGSFDDTTSAAAAYEAAAKAVYLEFARI